MAYQWSRPIPTSLKIIHSRVYAQVRFCVFPICRLLLPYHGQVLHRMLRPRLLLHAMQRHRHCQCCSPEQNIASLAM